MQDNFESTVSCAEVFFPPHVLIWNKSIIIYRDNERSTRTIAQVI